MKFLDGYECSPNPPFIGDVVDETEAVSWALTWLPEVRIIGRKLRKFYSTSRWYAHGLRNGFVKSDDRILRNP